MLPRHLCMFLATNLRQGNNGDFTLC